MTTLDRPSTEESPVARPGPALGPVAPSRDLDGRIAGFLRRGRTRLARTVLGSMAEWAKWEEARGLPDRDSDAYAARMFGPMVDYLALYFATREESYRHLFIGEFMKHVHAPEFDLEERQRRREEVVGAVRRGFAGAIDRDLPGEAGARLRSELDPILATIAQRMGRSLGILLIGDCLMLDVMTFLSGPCREDGIDLNPTYLGSRNPVEFRKSLQALPPDGFAMVAYSPYTYTSSADFSRTITSGRVLIGLEAVREMIGPGLDEVRSNLDLIAGHFECPILVHNASNIRRHNGSIVDRLKAAASRRARRIARREANWVLDQHVKNLGRAASVSILDEEGLLGRYSEWELGRRYYDSELTHPTVLSRHLAPIYRDHLTVQADLMGKKLVVCDLDNTLWEGEIGEGPVRHLADRQATLKRLRRKGILLAINSKNDPRNVHWEGSELDEADFVASRINWKPKADNMREIRDALNLKPKDFIFIDDRADQREMVSALFPEILALDATSDRAWRALELWSERLPEDDGPDRTRLYHDREKRESFIESEAGAVDAARMMERLGLEATLRVAKESELKRVVELINRTNQFNLNGSRTTPAEIRAWLHSPDKSILVADGADKFGPMGTVCVAAIEQVGAEVRIPIFVLSCRVFGYGFETAVLNAIGRRAARAGEAASIVGLYRETPVNQPCRSMYPDHGFRWADDRWRLDAIAPAPDPSWLKVTDKTA